MGVPADPDDVVTSAQAAARVLRERFGDGARVLMLGADGLRAALEAEAAGRTPMQSLDDPEDDVRGDGDRLRPGRAVARRHAVGGLVRDGLPWVASNTDMTIPTAYGVAPGHGVLVPRCSGSSPG